MGGDGVQILSAPLRLLKLHGLWPENGLSDIIYITRVIFILVLFGIPWSGCMLHFLHSTVGNGNYTRDDILEDFAILAPHTGIYIVSISFINKRKEVKALIANLNSFEKFGKPPTLNKTNKMMNLLCKIFYTYTIIACMIYNMVGLLNIKQCEEENLKLNLGKVCGLVFPIWLPVDLATFPRFQTLYVFQCAACLMINNSGVLLMSFFIGLVEILNTRVVHLKQMISEVFKYEDNDEKRKHLKTCILYHIDIISLVATVNFTLGKIFLLFISAASVIISVIGFQFILTFELRSLLHIVGWISALSMPCYAGQRLIDEFQTSSIATEIYSIEWYKGDMVLHKDILFMIMRANHCLKLDAEGFGYMSFSAFLSVLQASYSYLTLLYQTYK